MKQWSRIRQFTVFCILGVLLLTVSCATPYQVLRYQTTPIRAEHVIAGIEPEEAVAKILVAAKGYGLAPETGNPAERRFLAERAAIMDGYRRLSERLAGMMVESASSTGYNRLDQDRIVTESRAFLKGAQVNGVTYEGGVATADVRVYIEPRASVFSAYPTEHLLQ